MKCGRCNTSTWPLTILRTLAGLPVCERCAFLAGERYSGLYGHRHTARCAEQRARFEIN